MHRLARIGLIGALVCALGVPAAPAVAAPARQTTNIPFDISAQLKDKTPPRQKADSTQIATLEVPADIIAEHGDPDLVLELYDWSVDHGGPHSVPFWKEASGEHSDVYVGWADLTAPATSSQQAQTITPEQVQYMADEFDSKIWESDVFHFGNYAPRPATAEGERAAIMVYNIRDDAYWTSFRYYTAGYFWGGLNDAIQMNAIFIDSFDWANRTGPDSARPYLYEGTIAHEFQHLIHSDVDSDEDSFLDEGMADMAEQFLYGTVGTGSHIGEYLFYHRDSLIDWDGELYDYGNAVLWQDYLFEQMGGGVLQGHPDTRVTAGYAADKFADTDDKFADPGDAFIWNLIHNQNNGLSSIADLVGGPQAVEDLHRDYTLANLLDGKVSEPKWNYRNLALGGPDSDYYTIDDGIKFYDAGVGGNMPPTRKTMRHPLRGVSSEAWGAFYRVFAGVQPGFTMSFAGSAGDGVAAHSAPSEWYAGLGNALDRSLSRTFTVAPGDTLSFWTWFDIEEDWDYGYVEASSNGVDWIPLTQTSALQAGASNVYGSSAYDYAGGLTGSSGGWALAAYDLGAMTGDVQIRFRYKTDEAVNGLGWYVDDVAVGAYTDAVTADTRALWSDGGWAFTDGLQVNDWTADAYSPYAKAGMRGFTITPLIGTVGLGTVGSAYIPAPYLKNARVYSVISNRPSGTFESGGRLTVVK